jgi:hypothetical protein
LALTQVARRPSKSKALERRCQTINEWYGPLKKAARIEVPKKLQGIREVRRMYWIYHEILQIPSGLHQRKTFLPVLSHYTRLNVLTLTSALVLALGEERRIS